MNSMTGFGSGSADSPEAHIEAELRSVNQRGLQLQLNAPREWGGLDKELSNWLRNYIERGKVSVTLSVSQRDGDGVESVNWAEVDKKIQLLQSALERNNLSSQPITSEVVYRIVSETQKESGAPAWETVEKTVFAALENAVSGFLAMRAEEGNRLKKEFSTRTHSLREMMVRISTLDQGRTVQHKDALQARLQKMNLDFDLTDERVAKEIALLADRSDISEEITRVGSHLQSLEETIESDEAVGRKIEFLLQELHREFNTIGSKASLVDLSGIVIEAKQELEKLREQAANIE